MTRTSIALGVLLAAAAPSCYTGTTEAYTYTAPSSVYGMTGQVVAVNEVVRTVSGNPVGGAAAGALIGGALFGFHGAEALFGAAAGAGTGAALSSGSYQTRAYDVIVQFDDGRRGQFTYRDYSPLRPGERVMLTPTGPVPIRDGGDY